MWDFSDDESCFCFVSAVVVAAAGLPLWVAALRIKLLGRSILRRLFMLALPIVALISTGLVLDRWADPQVVGHADYITLFLLGNAAWLAGAARLLPTLGINMSDDCIDRDNPAAQLATGGFLTGVSLIYALANVGTGPTIWTTLIPAAAASIALWSLAVTLALVCRDLVDNITIDRDVASAVRFAAVMIGMSLILGRAAGGSWSSWRQTGADLLRLGWPAIVVAMLAAVFDHLLQPTPHAPRPRRRAGLVPAGILIGWAVIVFTFMPHGLHPSQW